MRMWVAWLRQARNLLISVQEPSHLGTTIPISLAWAQNHWFRFKKCLSGKYPRLFALNLFPPPPSGQTPKWITDLTEELSSPHVLGSDQVWPKKDQRLNGVWQPKRPFALVYVHKKEEKEEHDKSKKINRCRSLPRGNFCKQAGRPTTPWGRGVPGANEGVNSNKQPSHATQGKIEWECTWCDGDGGEAQDSPQDGGPQHREKRDTIDVRSEREWRTRESAFPWHCVAEPCGRPENCLPTGGRGVGLHLDWTWDLWETSWKPP